MGELKRRPIEAFIDDFDDNDDICGGNSIDKEEVNVDILQKYTEQFDISDKENSEQPEYRSVVNAIPKMIITTNQLMSYH